MTTRNNVKRSESNMKPVVVGKVEKVKAELLKANQWVASLDNTSHCVASPELFTHLHSLDGQHLEIEVFHSGARHRIEAVGSVQLNIPGWECPFELTGVYYVPTLRARFLSLSWFIDLHNFRLEVA